MPNAYDVGAFLLTAAAVALLAVGVAGMWLLRGVSRFLDRS